MTLFSESGISMKIKYFEQKFISNYLRYRPAFFTDASQGIELRFKPFSNILKEENQNYDPFFTKRTIKNGGILPKLKYF